MIHPVHTNAVAALPAQKPTGLAKGEGGTFAAELKRAQGSDTGIRFSQHAQKRLAERSIVLDPEDHARIAQSTDIAASKGARETVLLMDRLALVVGVPNRTVITVMDAANGQPAVFTNVDSVVVAPPKGV